MHSVKIADVTLKHDPLNAGRINSHVQASFGGEGVNQVFSGTHEEAQAFMQGLLTAMMMSELITHVEG